MSAAATLAGAAPGGATAWHAIPWRQVWRTVRRLQARIVKAVQVGRWNKVRALVYLLTHSCAGRAAAVLRVISNRGARTPGIDGVVWDTPEAKATAFHALRRRGYRPQPLRRVYDRISHRWLEAHIPMDQAILHRWLKAGYLEKGVFVATLEGTPQGGIISPALANATLNGLETLLQQRFGATKRQHAQNKVHLVRYADDFLITGTSEKLLRCEVRPLVAHFLRERGLELSHEKTRITRSEDGFDFLGQHVRRYGHKVLLKPSTKNVRALLAKVENILRGEGRHVRAGLLIDQLNPIVRGWACYHRHAVSSRTYARVDHLIFGKLWRWARRRHPTKSARWVKAKYFTRRGALDWVFQGRTVDGLGHVRPVFLYKTASTKIRRHVAVPGMANPYDPTWEISFEERLSARMAEDLHGRTMARYLWERQGGKCPACGQGLTLEDGWHLHHVVWRVYGGSDACYNRMLLHANCHRQVHHQGLPMGPTASCERR